ncbi:hypothetical protein [Pedobacter sp. NJ-S-72]
MKLVSYKTEDREHLGVFISGHIYNLNSCDKQIPNDMNEFLKDSEVLMERADWRSMLKSNQVRSNLKKKRFMK